ncbi:hypothetical protein SAMN02799630_02974 [Paenibacillus sp. UNCCL117]|nr:hypothetical protein SAMN04488602_12282 [Paenibacillus sp. cl123]SFW42515.1 hypothetical protein SAMN02799630_02974 [Paenibacillus sp. UNCCL117]
MAIICMAIRGRKKDTILNEQRVDFKRKVTVAVAFFCCVKSAVLKRKWGGIARFLANTSHENGLLLHRSGK